ncbi:DUF302 domain-containing protein [Chryseolinea soli]|uniref:DUF302 domain-containing protein n=1 Tax=Chryseolinea soli TaxID=2321403 RepID=A0A385SGR0_9BACT|nr:DUF302 domain-containing protein [Chryseolinea soli]AYB29651.1 DUF302 domain-containing protein [Chryseolinea soli]
MSGLKNILSDFSVKETLDRLAALVSSHGLTVFICIDHAANADEVGLPLRPTEVIIFGNPKAGTVLMQDKQTAGLDLPMKALAWEDENGKVWLTYNEVQWISQRHGLTDKSAVVVKAIEDGMTMVCNAATKKKEL